MLSTRNTWMLQLEKKKCYWIPFEATVTTHNRLMNFSICSFCPESSEGKRPVLLQLLCVCVCFVIDWLLRVLTDVEFGSTSNWTVGGEGLKYSTCLKIYYVAQPDLLHVKIASAFTLWNGRWPSLGCFKMNYYNNNKKDALAEFVVTKVCKKRNKKTRKKIVK